MSSKVQVAIRASRQCESGSNVREFSLSTTADFESDTVSFDLESVPDLNLVYGGSISFAMAPLLLLFSSLGHKKEEIEATLVDDAGDYPPLDPLLLEADEPLPATLQVTSSVLRAKAERLRSLDVAETLRPVRSSVADLLEALSTHLVTARMDVPAQADEQIARHLDEIELDAPGEEKWIRFRFLGVDVMAVAPAVETDPVQLLVQFRDLDWTRAIGALLSLQSSLPGLLEFLVEHVEEHPFPWSALMPGPGPSNPVRARRHVSIH